MKKIKKILFIITLVITVVIFCVAGLVGYILYWPLQPKADADQVDILVKWGSSFQSIAEQMHDKKVIRDIDQFKITAKLYDMTTRLRTGKFTLSTGMSNYAALMAIIKGPQSFVQVTLPEGYRASTFAAILATQMDLDSLNIINLVSDSAFIADLDIDAESLQGYLYPETYNFTYGLNEKQVLTTLVNQFKKVTSDSLWQDAADIGLDKNAVLTMASIIEGEAMLTEEMPIISSVYHNRIARGMLLQADPTVQYIIPDGPRRLLNRDLLIDSPYNTYKYSGLPPGPINNPGIHAIRAAVYPAETDYLYFVAVGDGSHDFSETYNAHLRAKRKFDIYRRQVEREKREKNEHN